MTERAADPTPEALAFANEHWGGFDGPAACAKVVDAFAQARAEAEVAKEREYAAGSIVSHFLASNDAAFWDNNPRPWRVEEDWTCEITAANGRIVSKLPYPRDLGLAHAIVRTANTREDDAAVDAEIEALLRGEQP